jgi:hypothetical protein
VAGGFDRLFAVGIRWMPTIGFNPLLPLFAVNLKWFYAVGVGRLFAADFGRLFPLLTVNLEWRLSVGVGWLCAVDFAWLSAVVAHLAVRRRSLQLRDGVIWQRIRTEQPQWVVKEVSMVPISAMTVLIDDAGRHGHTGMWTPNRWVYLRTDSRGPPIRPANQCRNGGHRNGAHQERIKQYPHAEYETGLHHHADAGEQQAEHRRGED